MITVNNVVPTKKIMIIVTNPPYTNRISFEAYKYASYLLDHGIRPIIFHFMDGIYNLNITQHPLNFPNMAEEGKKLLEKGAELICCSRCLVARGFFDNEKSDFRKKRIITAHIIDGVKVTGVSEISRRIKDGYKILKY